MEFNGVYQSMTKQAAITVQVRLTFVQAMFFSGFRSGRECFSSLPLIPGRVSAFTGFLHL